MVAWHEDPALNLILPETVDRVASLAGPADYLFLVYGNRGELDLARVPADVQAEIRSSYPLALLPVGFITPGDLDVRGLVLTMTDAPNLFSVDQLSLVLRNVRLFMEAVGARAVGLAGRTPAEIASKRIPRHSSYIMGLYESTSTVIRSALAALRARNIEPEEVTFGVAGIGYFGRIVFRYLGRDLRYRVVGYDPAIPETSFDRDMIFTNDPSYLFHCREVITLPPDGEMIRYLLEHCQPGTIFLDDSHPRPSREVMREVREVGELVFAGVAREGIEFFPPLPGRLAQEIPGCCLGAILRAKGRTIRSVTQASLAAEEFGFVPLLATFP